MAQKKIYVRTARRIKTLKTAIAINVPDSAASQEAVLAFAEGMAVDFADSHHDVGNGPFNPVRFMTACGYPDWQQAELTVKLTEITPELLSQRKTFTAGQLTGQRVQPWNKSEQYRRWAKGSVVRTFAGALNEHGTAGVIEGGGSSPLPPLGELDPAPAMAMALGEASYIIRSHGTVIAWWLSPEVYGVGPDGEWVEVSERCSPDYGRFDGAISRHQNLIHRLLFTV